MKKVLAIALVAVLAIAFSVTALAAQVNLKVGTDVFPDSTDGRLTLYPTITAGDGGDEWYNAERTLSITDIALNVDAWVIEFTADAPAVDAAVVQYEDNWWLDCGTSVVSVDGTTVTIDVKAMRAAVDLAGMANVNLGKLTLASWSSPFTLDQVVSSYVITSGGGGSSVTSVPGTGVVTFIGIALAGLAVSGTGVAIIGSKLKKK